MVQNRRHDLTNTVVPSVDAIGRDIARVAAYRAIDLLHEFLESEDSHRAKNINESTLSVN